MLNKEQFREFIELVKKYEDISDSWYNLGIDILNSDLFNISDKISSLFISSHFTNEGYDLVTWWLYENVSKEIYENDTTIVIDTVDKFWEFLIKDKDIYLLD